MAHARRRKQIEKIAADEIRERRMRVFSPKRRARSGSAIPLPRPMAGCVRTKPGCTPGGPDIIGSIAGGEGIGRIHRACWQFAATAMAQVRLQIGSLRRVGGLFALFQSPLLLGRINQPQIVDARILLRGGAGLNKVRNRDGRKQANDGHNDHDFHQGKTQFLGSFCFHVFLIQRLGLKTTACSALRRSNFPQTIRRIIVSILHTNTPRKKRLGSLQAFDKFLIASAESGLWEDVRALKPGCTSV